MPGSWGGGNAQIGGSVCGGGSDEGQTLCTTYVNYVLGRLTSFHSTNQNQSPTSRTLGGLLLARSVDDRVVLLPVTENVVETICTIDVGGEQVVAGSW